jgi:O-antigen/teichoic acid export membrane protein
MNLLFSLMSRSLIGQGLGLISLLLVKSQLTSEDFGRYVLLVGILQLATVPFGNPMHTFLVKVNQDRDNFQIHSMFFILLLSITLLVGMGLFPNGYGAIISTICIGILSIFSITIYTGVLRVNKKHVKALIFDNTVRPLLFFLVVLSIFVFQVNIDYQEIFSLYVGVIALCAVLAFLSLCLNNFKITYSWANEFSEYWAILLMLGGALLYPNLVILIIGYHQHYTFVGDFRILERLSKLVSIGQNSGNYIFANIFKSVKNLPNEIKKTQHQSTLIGSLIFSVLAVMIFYSSELSQIFNASNSFDFSDSLIIFIVLGMSQIINCYFAPYSTALIFLNKSDLIMKVQICLIIISLIAINVFLNFFHPQSVVFFIAGYFLLLNLSRKFIFDKYFYI